mmetsp:Transcript_16677/g.53278  ORF Transcript_16677/g.53278 Transcript_16677/m.53278 type:complete len:531 (-) Transcript_16677:131-1723(-)
MLSLATALAAFLLPTAPPTASEARVVFVVPPTKASPFGATSPEPAPSWRDVATHLAARLPGFDERIAADVVREGELAETKIEADVILALGASTSAAAAVQSSGEAAAALLCYDCAPQVQELERVGAFEVAEPSLQAVVAWSDAARGKRLHEQATQLLSRHSSEDLLYAIFFVLHAYVIEMPLVRHTVNPTWEKGAVQNAAEFASMCTKCGDKIRAALTDPETKATIDLLNACDMRDQVGSYRVIVSYETPQLEEFSLCILQQNNCFGCEAAILETPRVPLLRRWRGAPVDAAAARQLFIGHFDCDEAAVEEAHRLPWSWKIVCGANPAYDAFPAQHQIFYPSQKSASALWYDPVFKVETLDGRQVWTKRHYRCSPRPVAADLAQEDGSSAGAWTLTTLDNGVLSREHWTTVDAADDLSWAIFHYSGCASVVGQSYLGALLCSPDGRWPEAAKGGAELERIRAAFRVCGIELFELYGHGPPDEGRSFMWTDAHATWQEHNPPPLATIGDQTVQQWRAAEKQEATAGAGAAS